MDTNRLSSTLAKALNAQMTNEAHNAQIYLSYAAWASGEGYDGIANFLFRHENEERNHMMKILEFILKRAPKWWSPPFLIRVLIRPASTTALKKYLNQK